MKSLYNAYQACKRQGIRGEFDAPLKSATKQSTPHEPLLAQFSNLHIHTGLRPKRRHAAGKPMAWSPMTRSKP